MTREEQLEASLRLLLVAIGRLPVVILTEELVEAIQTADAILMNPPANPPAPPGL